MILPLIFLAFVYIEPTLSIANNSLIFGYSIRGEGEFTKHQGNLHYLLGSLSSLTSINSFSNFTTSLTKTPNHQLHGVYLCRGDIDPQACQSCINSARKFILSHYPSGREAVVWYNHCMIRYSNESFLGKFDETMWSTSSDNKRVKGNRVQFMNILRRTLKGLANQASNEHNGNKFASTDVKLAMDGALSLQAMVQCTPDLVATDCYKCLMFASQKILRRGYGSKSARVLYKNCFVQYKTTNAFDDDMVESLPILPSPETNNSTLFHLRENNLLPRGDESNMTPSSSNESFQYSLDTMRTATKNFSIENKLGQGGFGAVFKGRLPNGQEVAVKRLSEDSRQGLREFTNEVQLVAKFQHRNLVKLLGFCIEGEEKLLVYEFVSNLSLDGFLFDQNKRKYLDWETRFKIIIGIARGLLYLHVDSRVKIIHRDLKSSNILLDDEMNPKIADFGMARLVKIDHTQANTSKVFGTLGYMAPEYLATGVFSIKSDVYSFGVMLLEILSGRSNNLFLQSFGQDSLINLAWRLWNTGTIIELVDPSLGNNFSRMEVLRCVQVGLLCVQADPTSRPTMESVVVMLQNNSSDIQFPHSPPSSDTQTRGDHISQGQEFESHESESLCIRSPVQVSDLYPR